MSPPGDWVLQCVYMKTSQTLKLRAQLLDDIADLLPATRRARFAYVESQMKRGRSGRDNMFEMISLWLTFWRDVGICVSRAEMPLVNIDKEALIRSTAGKVKLCPGSKDHGFP